MLSKFLEEMLPYTVAVTSTAGEVYEYVVHDADGEIVESCCGYCSRESAEADGAVALARWNKCGG